MNRGGAFSLLAVVVAIVVLSIGLVGCGQKGSYDTRWVGASEMGHYKLEHNGSYTYESRVIMKPAAGADVSCVRRGDYLDIRILDLKFSQIVDGGFQEIGGRSGNEYGVFVTLKEIPKARDVDSGLANATAQVYMDNRLVFTSFSRAEYEKINSDNIRVFTGRYNGGYLYMSIDVVEFDNEEVEGAVNALVELYEANKELASMASAGTTEVVSLLNKLGKAFLRDVSKDDLILHKDVEFIPCDLPRGNTRQYFLRSGHVLITRYNRDSNYWNKPTPFEKFTVTENNSVIDEGDTESSYLLMQIFKTN